jgi:hypothetical protein
MSQKIQVTKDMPDAMRRQGYIFGGSTTDETMLAEIRRDLLALGAKEVAFTHGKSGIIYWVKR